MLVCLILHCFFIHHIGLINSISKDDFYDYTKATVFSGSNIKLASEVRYPHWSDGTNTLIHITSSGIARFSGFSGTNTLDVLVYATAIPLSFKTIFYEQISSPTSKLQNQLKGDLSELNFTAEHVTIATWRDALFSFDKRSSFQMVFATDGNATYVLLQIDRIEHDKLLPYFPEVDLRYSYDGGTKFKRLDFLKTSTGISTRTELTGVTAAENSNCGKAGRWKFKVTDNPMKRNVTEDTRSTRSPPVVREGVFTNSSGLSFQGKFTFTSLVMDNNVLTSTENSDELNIILTKKSSDQRYGKLDTSIKGMINQLYKKASNSNDVTVQILSYRTGSLIVDYSMIVKNQKLCNGSSQQNCLDEVKRKVEKEVGDETITSGDLSGKIDQRKIEIQDFDECSTGTNCDVNAYCIDYSQQLSFACLCKEGYIGNGFPGNCKVKSNNYLTITMYLSIIVTVLSVSFILAFSYKMYQKGKLEEGEKFNAIFAKTEARKYGMNRRLPPLWYNPSSYRYGSDAFQRRKLAYYQ